MLINTPGRRSSAALPYRGRGRIRGPARRRPSRGGAHEPTRHPFAGAPPEGVEERLLTRSTYCAHVSSRSAVRRAPAPRARACSWSRSTSRTDFAKHDGVARLDEAAILAVDEAVAGRDRARPAHDDGLLKRHRLQENGRRARIRVLANGKGDDASPAKPLEHSLEGKVELDRDVCRHVRPALARRHWSRRRRRSPQEAPARPRAGAEVAVRIGADGHDVVPRGDVGGSQRVGVDAERHERDRHAAAPLLSQPRRSSASRAPYARIAAQRDSALGVQPPHALRAKLRQALGKPDGDVHERRPEQPRTPGEEQRYADRVDGREHDVRAVRRAQRPEHGREIASVPSGSLEAALRQAA